MSLTHPDILFFRLMVVAKVGVGVEEEDGEGVDMAIKVEIVKVVMGIIKV